MKKALALLAFVFLAATSVLAQEPPDGGGTHGGFASPVAPFQSNPFAWLFFLILILRSLLGF